MKAKICDNEGLSLHVQRLIFDGKHLEDNELRQTLKYYGVKHENTVHLVLAVGASMTLFVIVGYLI